MFIPEYRNRDARSASMEAIASELNLTIKEVPKKIKVLRSTYYLELAKIGKVKLVVQALIICTSLYCISGAVAPQTLEEILSSNPY